MPVDTTPLAAITGSMQPFLPHGVNGKTWRRWLSEMQMLLHGHAVNAAREARGRMPVTGIWIAGGGTLARDPVAALPRVHATPRAEGDVARGAARLAGVPAADLPDGFANLGGPDALVVLPPVDTDEALAHTARAWLDQVTATLASCGC